MIATKRRRSHLTLDGDWALCPLFLEFEEAKLTYLKDIRRSQWRQEQEERLWEIVQEAFAGSTDPCSEYWAKRIFDSFCRRLHNCTKYDWVYILAGFTDEQAFGSYAQEKAKRYCCLVRTTARDYLEKHPTMNRKGFDR